MKRIAFFDTKPYDKESFERQNNGRYDIRYFETRLTAAALPLADGCDAACAFVNAEIDRAVVEGLVKRGIKVLAMRCAGYNNVDFKAAYEAGLTVVRVPAYSPYAVAEHAAGNGADADSNGDLGFRDFVPHSNNIITHLYCDRARDQNNVSLTWRTGIKTAEAFDVVARNKRRRGKFDIAAIAGARVNAEQPGRTD